MFAQPKQHRFEVGEECRFYVADCECWDVTVIRRTWFLWWLPSYTIAVFDLDNVYTIPGVLDCSLKKKLIEIK